nr:hypothetical protein [Candidatus Microthrix sp.]
MLAAVNTVAAISARYGTMFSGPRPLSAVAVNANTKGGDERAQAVLHDRVVAEPAEKPGRELAAAELNDEEHHRHDEPGEGDHAATQRGQRRTRADRAQVEGRFERAVVVEGHERDAGAQGDRCVQTGNDPEAALDLVADPTNAPATGSRQAHLNDLVSWLCTLVDTLLALDDPAIAAVAAEA